MAERFIEIVSNGEVLKEDRFEKRLMKYPTHHGGWVDALLDLRGTTVVTDQEAIDIFISWIIEARATSTKDSSNYRVLNGLATVLTSQDINKEMRFKYASEFIVHDTDRGLFCIEEQIANALNMSVL